VSDPLRDAEARSIREFVQRAADEGYLSGRVLDYGCGKQPYRDIVEDVGTYFGYDQTEFAGNVSGEDIGDFDLPWEKPWKALLCTQVLQYVREPGGLLSHLFEHILGRGGHLVLTYPTNWPEVEPDDLHRFTKAGMERLLTEAGFTIVRHDLRHSFQHAGSTFAAGYGVIARA
jgi:hypothetical protein